MISGTDFVFPWINSGPFAKRDLVFALRSLDAYWLGHVRVTVVGDDPGMTKLWHAPHTRAEGGDHPKAVDAVNKMLAIIGLGHVQERFVYMYDDTYLLQKMDEVYMSIRRATAEIPKDWTGTAGTRKHNSALANTVQVLRENGFTRIWNYETHMPRFFEKRKMLEVIHTYKAEQRNLLLPTLYFNHHYRHQEPQLLHKFDDCKVIFTGRNDGVGIAPARTANEVAGMAHYRQALINKHFWNHNDRGMKDVALQYLRNAIWPTPSPFEGKHDMAAT